MAGSFVAKRRKRSSMQALRCEGESSLRRFGSLLVSSMEMIWKQLEMYNRITMLSLPGARYRCVKALRKLQERACKEIENMTDD